MELVVSVACLLVMVILLLFWHSVHRAFGQLRARMVGDARQTEALVSLVAAMGPRLPLPRMRDWAISPDLAAILVDDAARTHEREVVRRWKQRWPNLLVRDEPTEKGLCLLEWHGPA